MDLETLLRATREGQTGARDRLVRQLRSIYLALFRQKFDYEDAQDLTQQTLADVLHGLPNVEPRVSLRSWAMRIARNNAADAYKAKDRRAVGLVRLALQLLTPRLSPNSRIQRDRLLEILRTAIARLPTHLRVVIEADLVDDDQQSELAAKLGVTRVTLRTRRHRAHAQLRSQLVESLGVVLLPSPARS